MTICGIGYKMRRGKDTAASALVRELGFTRVAFADPLKALAYEANPLILTESPFVNVQIGHNSLATAVDRNGWDHTKDHYPLSRQFLQRLGQAGRKVFGENFWFERWCDTAGVDQDPAISHDDIKVVVPDVRFLNEAEGLRGLGAILIRIDRVVQATAGSNDISETELDAFTDWDAVIVNDGSVVDLEKRIVEVVREHSKSKAKVDVTPSAE